MINYNKILLEKLKEEEELEKKLNIAKKEINLLKELCNLQNNLNTTPVLDIKNKPQKSYF